METCLELRSTCGYMGIPELGYCVDNDQWVWCDRAHGILSVRCSTFVGAGSRCATLASGSSTGACTCGTIGENGTCTTVPLVPGSSTQLHFYCLTVYDLLVVENCGVRVGTGAINGFCSSLVTDAGYQTQCFCGSCNVYDYASQTCAGNPCLGYPCTYNAAANVHFCQ